MSARRRTQHVESTSSEDSPKSPQYYVEDVLDMKFDGKQILYHTKWLDYEETTWEPEENFVGEWSMETLKKFMEKNKERMESLIHKDAAKPSTKTPAKSKMPSKAKTSERAVRARNLRAASEESTMGDRRFIPRKRAEHKNAAVGKPKISRAWTPTITDPEEEHRIVMNIMKTVEMQKMEEAKTHRRTPRRSTQEAADAHESEQIEGKTPVKTPRKRRAKTEDLEDGTQPGQFRVPFGTPGNKKKTKTPANRETGDPVEASVPCKQLKLSEQEEMECQNSVGSSRTPYQPIFIPAIRRDEIPDVPLESKMKNGKVVWQIHSEVPCMKCIFHEKQAKKGEKCEFSFCDCEICESFDSSNRIHEKSHGAAVVQNEENEQNEDEEEEEIEDEEDEEDGTEKADESLAEQRFKEHHLRSCRKTCRKCRFHKKIPGNKDLCPFFYCTCKKCQSVDRANMRRFVLREKENAIKERREKEAAEQNQTTSSSVGSSRRTKSPSRPPNETDSTPKANVTQRKKKTTEKAEISNTSVVPSPVAPDYTPVMNREIPPPVPKHGILNTPSRNVGTSSEVQTSEGPTVLDHLTDTTEDPQMKKFLQRSAEKRRARSKTPSTPAPMPPKIMQLLNEAKEASASEQPAEEQSKAKTPQKRAIKRTVVPLPKVPPLPQKKTRAQPSSAPEVPAGLQNVNSTAQAPTCNVVPAQALPAEQNPIVRNLVAPEVRPTAPVVPGTQQKAVVQKKKNVPSQWFESDITTITPDNFLDFIRLLIPKAEKDHLMFVNSVLELAMKKRDSQLTGLSIEHGANIAILMDYLRNRPYGGLSTVFAWHMVDVRATLKDARDIFCRNENWTEVSAREEVFTFPIESKRPFVFKCKRERRSANAKCHLYLVFHCCALFGRRDIDWEASCSMPELETMPVLNDHILHPYVTKRNEKSSFFRIPKFADEREGEPFFFTVYPPKDLGANNLVMQLVHVQTI